MFKCNLVLLAVGENIPVRSAAASLSVAALTHSSIGVYDQMSIFPHDWIPPSFGNTRVARVIFP